jgi:predicted ATPase
MMFVLVWMTVVHLFRRNVDAAARCTTTLLRLAEERGARFWLSVGTWLQGAGLVQAGRPEEALIQLRAGSRHFFAVGSRQYEPYIRYSEAEAHLLCDRADESAVCLGLAQQAVEQTNQRFFEPEVHRIAAKLHRSRGEFDKAEACYRRAVEQARGQSGRSWELRAATGLARLCLEQGRHVEAREILAPVYGWFTEGFDTPDLKEARALLDELRE